MDPLPTPPAGYRFVRTFARAVSALFYRHLDLVGGERIPATGPLIVAANHQNALVDPMLLVATLPRRLRPLAKAPLFRHPLVRPFLAAVGAVPVQRAIEAGHDPARNDALFRATAEALLAGEAILIFPEGIGHNEPALQPLRTGAARMLLGARAAGAVPVTLLPVGLVFRQPGRFREGAGAILVGEPISTADCEAQWATAPEVAVRTLTARLADGLRRQMVEADTWRTERLLRVAETVWREESAAAGARDAGARTRFLQRLARAYGYLLEREPARLRRLRRGLDAYAEVLERAGLRGRHLEQEYRTGAVIRYAVRETATLVVALPLALVGLLLHATGFWLTDTAVRIAAPEPDVEATYKILGGVLFYPLSWVAEGWVAWRAGGAAVLVAFLVLLLPTGFLALAWRERLARAAGEARALWRYVRHPDLRRHLAERREDLARALEELAEQVPEEVLAGPPAATPASTPPPGER
jgi:1-acyl-sn-glycerol-3-phosphate acyltransferase